MAFQGGNGLTLGYANRQQNPNLPGYGSSTPPPGVVQTHIGDGTAGNPTNIDLRGIPPAVIPAYLDFIGKSAQNKAALDQINAQDVAGLDQSTAAAVQSQLSQQAQLWSQMDQMLQSGQNNLDLTSLQGQNQLNQIGLQNQGKINQLGALGPLLQGVTSGFGLGGSGGSSSSGFGGVAPVSGINTNYGSGVSMPYRGYTSGGGFGGGSGSYQAPQMSTNLGLMGGGTSPFGAGAGTQQAPKATVAPTEHPNYFPNLQTTFGMAPRPLRYDDTTGPNVVERSKQRALANMYQMEYSPIAGGWSTAQYR